MICRFFVFATDLLQTSPAKFLLHFPPPPMYQSSTSPKPVRMKATLWVPPPSNCSHGAEARQASWAAVSKRFGSTQLQSPTCSFPLLLSLFHHLQAEFQYPTTPRWIILMARVLWRWAFVVGFSTLRCSWMVSSGYGEKGMAVDLALATRILRLCPPWTPIWILSALWLLVGCTRLHSSQEARSSLGQFHSEKKTFLAFWILFWTFISLLALLIGFDNFSLFTICIKMIAFHVRID